MSDKTESDKKDTPLGTPEEDIIEATVIEETPAPERTPEPASGTSSGTRASAPPKSSFATKAGWSVAALLAAFAGGVYLAPQFAPGLSALGINLAPPAVQGTSETVDLTPLMAELQTMGDTLARHKEILAQQEAALQAAVAENMQLKNDLAVLAASGTGPTTATDPAGLQALQAEVARLSDDLARLSTLSDQADPNITQLTGALSLARAEVAQMKSRLKSVEQAMQAVQAGALEASPRGRLVLALGRLKDRAVMGQPFGPALSALRPDFAALPAIDQQLIGADLGYLEARGGGVTPYETLLAEFDRVAATAITETDKAEGGFLANLFSVRRTDAGATGIDAVLLAAERRLTARDVAGAVKALEALEGPALEATSSWRARAGDYAGTMQAFDRLTLLVAQSDTKPDTKPLAEGAGR